MRQHALQSSASNQPLIRLLEQMQEAQRPPARSSTDVQMKPFLVVIVAGSYSQEGTGAMGAGMGHDAPALARRHSWHGLLHATEQEAPMILQPQHREAAAGLVGPEISDDSK